MQGHSRPWRQIAGQHLGLRTVNERTVVEAEVRQSLTYPASLPRVRSNDADYRRPATDAVTRTARLLKASGKSGPRLPRARPKKRHRAAVIVSHGIDTVPQTPVKGTEMSGVRHLGQLDRQTAKPLHSGQETGDLVDPARTVKVGLGLHETTCAVRSKPVTSHRRKRCSHLGGVHQPQLLKPSQSARNGGKPTPRKLAGSPVQTNGNSQTPRSALESSALSSTQVPGIFEPSKCTNGLCTLKRHRRGSQ